MKKGRHRRYEEARKFKRSQVDNLEGLIASFKNEPEEYIKPEHASWAEEFANDDYGSTTDSSSDQEQEYASTADKDDR